MSYSTERLPATLRQRLTGDGPSLLATFVLIPRVEIVEVDELDDTDRGAGGFGHTGN